ncbi:hypothetical protein [uncultured Clostridium sp.]|uniref:hypothetical protein n=1 Tax=uncultured Clostridium sp. TaxID=59620 RepID=UPI0025FBF253|nr:hypothetical protein [uncultured Clostridium sp.]
MIRKTFNFVNMIFAVSLSIIALNLTTSNMNPNRFFPLIFVLIGFCNTLLGINLLNDNKKILSFFSFVLAAFMFISVGSNIIFS